MALKAIQTEYKGYRFRSRLEARWAVFFDTLGLEYEYEPEGFDCAGVWYLPDFRIIDPSTDGFDLWLEIKPQRPLTGAEKRKVLAFSIFPRGWFRILSGSPWADSSGVAYQTIHASARGSGKPFIKATRELWIECLHCGEVSLADYPLFESCDERESIGCVKACAALGCYECWGCCRDDEKYKDGDELQFVPPEGSLPFLTPLMIQAYKAARQARFEHGEKP